MCVRERYEDENPRALGRGWRVAVGEWQLESSSWTVATRRVGPGSVKHLEIIFRFGYVGWAN